MDQSQPPELFITFSFDVKIIRFISNVLVPSDLSLTASIERPEGPSDAEVELALTKWRYWFEHVVGKSVVFCTDNDHALAMMIDDDGHNRSGNLMMLTPEEPSDEVLAAMFQSKMNALANGHITCSALDIKSDNMHGLSFTLAGDHSSLLPDKTEDWLGGPCHFERPWWTRNDASGFDIPLTSDSDPSTTPAWAYSLDFLDRASRQPVNTKDAGKSIAGRPTFSPTVINGGKPDDE